MNENKYRLIAMSAQPRVRRAQHQSAVTPRTRDKNHGPAPLSAERAIVLSNPLIEAATGDRVFAADKRRGPVSVRPQNRTRA